MNKSYSKQLNMVYTYDNGILTFTDGTMYTVNEALQLTTASDKDICAVHDAKNVFDGEIVSPPDDPDAWHIKIDECIMFRDIVPRELKWNHELDFLASKFSGVKICRDVRKNVCSATPGREKWRKGDITEKELQTSLFPF